MLVLEGTGHLGVGGWRFFRRAEIRSWLFEDIGLKCGVKVATIQQTWPNDFGDSLSGLVALWLGHPASFEQQWRGAVFVLAGVKCAISSGSWMDGDARFAFRVRGWRR